MEELSDKSFGAGKPSVLIVDDEAGIRKLLTTVLNEKGYSAVSAENGAEAVKKTNERYFNLALIDIILPDINGVELLSARATQEGNLGTYTRAARKRRTFFCPRRWIGRLK